MTSLFQTLSVWKGPSKVYFWRNIGFNRWAFFICLSFLQTPKLDEFYDLIKLKSCQRKGLFKGWALRFKVTLRKLLVSIDDNFYFICWPPGLKSKTSTKTKNEGVIYWITLMRYSLWDKQGRKSCRISEENEHSQGGKYSPSILALLIIPNHWVKKKNN